MEAWNRYRPVALGRAAWDRRATVPADLVTIGRLTNTHAPPAHRSEPTRRPWSTPSAIRAPHPVGARTGGIRKDVRARRRRPGLDRRGLHRGRRVRERHRRRGPRCVRGANDGTVHGAHACHATTPVCCGGACCASTNPHCCTDGVNHWCCECGCGPSLQSACLECA